MKTIQVEKVYGRYGKFYKCVECGNVLEPSGKHHLVHPAKNACPAWWPLKLWETIHCSHVGETVINPQEDFFNLPVV